MSPTIRKILGAVIVVVVVVILIIIFGSIWGGDSSEEKKPMTEVETIRQLQKQVADLQKQLSEAKPTGSPAPSSQQPDPVVVIQNSAVDAEKQRWRDKVRDTKIAGEQKIAEAQETKEREEELQREVEDLEEAILRQKENVATCKRVAGSSDGAVKRMAERDLRTEKISLDRLERRLKEIK